MDVLTLHLPARYKHIHICPLIFVFSVFVLNGDREAARVALLGGKIIEMCLCKHYFIFWQK